MQTGKVNFLIGNSFGSEGKGNVCAYLAKTEKIDIAISNNTPNAGHCFIDDAGNTQVVKMLPVAGVAGGDPVMILGSGSGINVDRLLEEIEIHRVKPNKLYISPTAVIVNETCKEYERQNLQYISSTFQGSGAAMGLKAMRDKNIKLARDIPELQKYIKTDIPDFLLNETAKNKTILCEICQGYHLSVDSEFYPFCTSRPVNVGQALAYLDLPASVVGDVIGISRSYWIRVGSVAQGYSGDIYPDSKELTWEEVSKRIGRPVKEMTTVTKRVRRVFEFSRIGFEMGIRRNGINIIFLTFADYLLPDEKATMKKYLSDFGFDHFYFVNGFGEFGKNIERIE